MDTMCGTLSKQTPLLNQQGNTNTLVPFERFGLMKVRASFLLFGFVRKIPILII